MDYVNQLNKGLAVPIYGYHATTVDLQIGDVLLPPVLTDNLRETWRKDYLDVVFYTISAHSVRKYAKKIGTQTVYLVKAKNPHRRMGVEYICDEAEIIGKVNVFS